MNIRKFPARQFSSLFDTSPILTYEKDFRVKNGLAAVDMDTETYAAMTDAELLGLIHTRMRIRHAERNAATLEYLARREAEHLEMLRKTRNW
jgi:hypothetical protein